MIALPKSGICGPGLEPMAQRVLDTSPTALTWWDRELTCKFAERACVDWLGIDPELLVGCSLAVLFGPKLAGHLPHAIPALRGDQSMALVGRVAQFKLPA